MTRLTDSQRKYRAGERKFAEWLDHRDVVLKRTVDLGLQKDDEGWDHFAWKLIVGRRVYGLPLRQTDRQLDDEPVSYEFDYRMGTGIGRKPRLTDLIASLISDAECVVNTEGFVDFCSELGYDTDSRKAEETYRQIQENNGRLLRLFPTFESLSTLIDVIYPYIEEAGLA